MINKQMYYPMYLVPGYLYNRLRSVLDNDENRELTNLNKIQSSKNKEENVANVNSNTSDLSMTTNVLDSVPKPSDQSKQTEVKLFHYFRFSKQTKKSAFHIEFLKDI